MKSSILIAILLLVSRAYCEEVSAPSAYDQVWDSLTLVSCPEGKVVQSLAVVGRLQADWVYFDSNNQGDYSDITWRRFRIGGKADLFHDFIVHAEVDLDLNDWGSNDSYNRLTDVYLRWKPTNGFNLKLGKQSAGFTLDGATSSKKLLALERSTIAENIWFPTEYFTGATGTGTGSNWIYKVGVFSASDDPELGEFDSGWFTLLSVANHLTDQLNLRFDYVYNHPDYTGNVGTKNLQNILSAVSQYESGKLGFWADLSFADGIAGQDQSNLLALELMPFWNFSQTWQAVFRYSWVHSTEQPGAVMGRYPTKIAGKAVRYKDVHDVYAGLNCFLYGHKLKWQSGIEYDLGLKDSVDRADYRGWGISTGIRLSW